MQQLYKITSLAAFSSLKNYLIYNSEKKKKTTSVNKTKKS